MAKPPDKAGVGRQMRDHGHLTPSPVPGSWPCSLFVATIFSKLKVSWRGCRFCCSLPMSLRSGSSVALCRLVLRLQTTRSFWAFLLAFFRSVLLC
jgi:hypothetical protein